MGLVQYKVEYEKDDGTIDVQLSEGFDETNSNTVVTRYESTGRLKWQIYCPYIPGNVKCVVEG